MGKQLDDIAFYQTISKVYRISLLIYNETGALQTRISPFTIDDEHLFGLAKWSERLFTLCSQTHHPQVISSELNQVWAAIPVIPDNALTQLIMIGPVYTSEVSEQLILDYARTNHLSTQSRERLLSAFKKTHIYPYIEFTRLISQIYYYLYETEMDISLLTTAGIPKEILEFSSEEHVHQKERLYDENFVHGTYAFEQYMWECVREGKLEKLKRHLLKSGTFGNIGPVANNDPIRQHKNAIIVAVGLAARSAIAGGLNPEVAYSLGDLYIQQLETMKDVLQILALAENMLYDFTTRVSNLKDTRQYSSLVRACCNFIDEHVRDNLRVSDVAAHNGLGDYYVSKKFKTETGMSLSDYIRDAKISEAKSLLKYSDLSLAEISELLSFSTQSFFTATFKKMTGITPRQYRETAGITR
jgi:YSIRK-targeted surface antigen transcriptional regulator